MAKCVNTDGFPRILEQQFPKKIVDYSFSSDGDDDDCMNYEPICFLSDHNSSNISESPSTSSLANVANPDIKTRRKMKPPHRKCIFCDKLILRLKKHILTVHKDKPEVEIIKKWVLLIRIEPFPSYDMNEFINIIYQS
mgnify:CR=1 FL=1